MSIQQTNLFSVYTLQPRETAPSALLTTNPPCALQVVRKPSGLVKNDKGQWVKPGKDLDSLKALESASFADEPQRFIPEREWRGQRKGYYFAMVGRCKLNPG